MQNSKNCCVSIIIVNYNGENVLPNCIKSIIDKIKVTYEIIVVDNNSTDNSVEMIRSLSNNIKIIKLDDNFGFGKACNIGVINASFNNIAFVNYDCVILEDIENLLIRLDEPDIGIIAPQVIYQNGIVQKTIGNTIGPIRLALSWFPLLNKLRCFQRNNQNLHDYLSEKQCDWLCGAFLIIKRNVWDKVFGFDESYFMYMEDVDLCEKVKRSGFVNLYYPKVKVIHLERSGANWAGEFAIINTFNSYRYYINKHYSERYFVVYKKVIKVALYLRIFVEKFLRSPLSKEKIDVYSKSIKLINNQKNV